MLQEDAILACSSNLLNSNIRLFAIRFQGPKLFNSFKFRDADTFSQVKSKI